MSKVLTRMKCFLTVNQHNAIQRLAGVFARLKIIKPGAAGTLQRATRQRWEDEKIHQLDLSLEHVREPYWTVR